MKINITEMMRVNGRLSDISDEMDSIFNDINCEFNNISNNINSAVLQQSINNIQNNISTLGSTFSNNMVFLKQFVSDQLTSYSVSNDEASAALQQLVTLVNGTFDENGNVLQKESSAVLNYNSAVSNGSASTTGAALNTKRADTNIGDFSSYSTGEGLQDVFANKIDNSQAKWDVVKTSYNFFKDKGLSDEQIAGIIGNMTQESALDLKCPTGQYQGLFQWGSDRYPSSWDLDTQLNHAWTEIESTRNNGKVLSNLSQKSSVGDATESFAYWFEGCTTEMDKRKKYANAVYYYIKNNL